MLYLSEALLSEECFTSSKMAGRCLQYFSRQSLPPSFSCFYPYQEILSPAKWSRLVTWRYSSDKKGKIIGTTHNLKNKTLFVNRPVEKKKRKDVPSPTGHFNVVACATAATYNLSGLRDGIQKYGDYILTELTNDSKSSCIFAVSRSQSSPEDRCIFYFKEGAVVLWNCDDLEQKLILDQLKLYEYQSYKESIVTREMESMFYTNSTNSPRSHITNDIIHLATKDHQRHLDMYTFSNSMALSVKLGSFESFLEDYINSTEFITEDLKEGKRIRISRSEVLRKSGELFALRHYINLSTDLTDTPDFYWDRDDLLQIYQSSCNYFSITLRTKVLNEKLNHCIELIELVSSHLNDRHHVRLEWMIIILIMIEIVFEVMHYLHK